MENNSETNREIAEFMGAIIYEAPNYFNNIVQWAEYPVAIQNDSDNIRSISSLEYNTSWDWLMPVVEKIEAMGNEVCITKASTGIYSENRDDPFESICFNSERSKLSATYQAVTQFIHWYKEQKKNENI